MLKRILPTAVAILVGILVLLSYVLPVEFLVQLRSVVLLPWATVIAAFALVVACLSVLFVHIRRLIRAKKNKLTSFLVILSGSICFGIVLLQGPAGPWSQQLMTGLLIPGESALLALTAVTLIVAGMRVFRTRRNAGGVVFIVTAAFILLTTVVYKFYPDILIEVRLRQFVDAIALSGMRGILMGVALGVILTGLRVILGIDRPYSDEG